MPGFDSVEWVLVDDGSTDRSVEMARAHGIDDVVSLSGRRGLASAFLAGLEEAVRRGADVIVNTDADNQYRGADVEKLVRPIVEGQADMVVGERPREVLARARLFRSVREFVFKQALTIVRIFVICRPVEVFAWPGLLCIALGLLPGLRFLLLYLNGRGSGHVRSLVLASILVSTGGLFLLGAIIASVSAANRVLFEDLRVCLRRMDIERLRTPSPH